MPIRIPTDLTIITLRFDGKEMPQRWTEAHAAEAFRDAAALLQDRLDIEFRMGLCERVVDEMPGGILPTAVDTAGYHYLTSAHRATEGVRVLFVDRLAQPELGGRSRHETRVCIIPHVPVSQAALRLAHELGHLLELPHIDAARRDGPGQERLQAAWGRNLMTSGAVNPTAEITPEQRTQARASALARRFDRPEGEASTAAAP